MIWGGWSDYERLDQKIGLEIITKYGAIVHMVERFLSMEEVRGSIPLSSSFFFFFLICFGCFDLSNITQHVEGFSLATHTSVFPTLPALVKHYASFGLLHAVDTSCKTIPRLEVKDKGTKGERNAVCILSSLYVLIVHPPSSSSSLSLN